jgi:hypothetical protein
LSGFQTAGVSGDTGYDCSPGVLIYRIVDFKKNGPARDCRADNYNASTGPCATQVVDALRLSTLRLTTSQKALRSHFTLLPPKAGSGYEKLVTSSSK